MSFNRYSGGGGNRFNYPNNRALPNYNNSPNRTPPLPKSSPPKPTPPPQTAPPPAPPAPVVVAPVVPTPPEPTNVSAVTKASRNLQKKKRTPKSIRKKALSNKLSVMMAPKPALSALHDIIPTIKYVVEQSTETNEFHAQAIDDEKVLGVGKGKSRNAARTAAAVGALKKLVNEIMTAPKQEETMEAEGEAHVPTTRMEKIPWSSLASYALHRLLDEWKTEGILSAANPAGIIHNGSQGEKPKGLPKERLPDNYMTMHPMMLLNLMQPGLICKKISQTVMPSSITIGYEIQGNLYTGTASNIKAARKNAAKDALKALYNITYPAVETSG